MRSPIKTVSVMLLALVSHGVVLADNVPVYDGFETYGVGTPLNNTSSGWGASDRWGAPDSTVKVQTNVVWAQTLGTNAVVVPPNTMASNHVVSAATGTNVWYDFYLTNSMAMAADQIWPDAVNTNLTVQLFVETNGYPVIWHPVSNAWLVCSNDYWNEGTTNFSTNAWMRFTVCANYSNHTAAIFLDEHLIRQQVRFINTNQDVSRLFRLIGGSSLTSYFDEVSIRYVPTNMTADLDNDGMPDWQEIQTYGNVDVARRLTLALAVTNRADGVVGGGWVSDPATNRVSLPWQTVATNLYFSASNGYYAAAVLTNGWPAGTFDGLNSNYAAYAWSNNQADVTVTVAFARMPAIAVSATHVGGTGIAGCTITASTNRVYPGGGVTFTLAADKAYIVSQLKTNGADAMTYSGQLTNASVLVTGIYGDLNVEGVFTYTGRRVVPGDYNTIQDAMAAALPGDTVVVNNGSSASVVALSNGVSVIATNTTLTGGLDVSAGMTGVLVSCTGLVVNSTALNGLLVVSNGMVDLGTVVFGAMGTVQVVNADAVIVNGITYQGSVILDGSSVHTTEPQTPPFSDDFERYLTNPPSIMGEQWHFGWSASDPGVIVQGAVYKQGVKAVEMPARTVLSCSLAPAASSNVWVEWNYREADRMDESQIVVAGAYTNRTVLLFIGTNNYVTVYNPEANLGTGAFNVLSNDVMGNPVAPLITSDWPRITVNLNYKTHRAAVMLNGRVLLQKLRFINTNQNNCALLKWGAGWAGKTYLDDLKVWTNASAVVSADTDGDGFADAEEVDHCGDVFMWPVGSVFKMR